MIRLRLLQAAPLLLLLLQVASIEGRINSTGCDTTKACWLSRECARVEVPGRDQEFMIINNMTDFAKYDEDCSKYFIVEPGIDDFQFELMISGIDKDKKVIIEYTQNHGTFTCQNQEVTVSDNSFLIQPQFDHDQQNFYCRFKVTKKTMNPSENFWDTFGLSFHPVDVVIKPEGLSEIKVDNYNEQKFLGRVPCPNSVFLDGVLDKEHFTKPLRDVSSRAYSCLPNYTMSHKLFTDAEQKIPEKVFKITKDPIGCRLGKVELYPGGTPRKVSSAKCARPRNSLCADLACANCTGLNNLLDGGRRTITCKQNFMIVNHNIISGPIATCHDDSTPENHLWSSREFTVRNIHEVKCVDKLDCNEITPFDDAKCQNCENVILDKGGIKCKDGHHMIMIDKISNAHHNVTITCNTRTGEWLLNYKGGKDVKGTQKEMTKWKLGCEGPKEKEKEEEDDKPVAAASSSLMYVGITLGALLFILLFLLLLYYICCRKGRKEPPKDESSKPPTPPTQPKTTESSNVEQAVEPPPPIAPASSDPEPALFSGKRVQFINMSQEHLREIEPDDPYKEVSARDKTDSERSKPSQMSQVGGTTDATGHTVTGRQTEKTNEMSRTVASGDDTRSDVYVSRSGGNTTLGDNSQTGGGGNTPTIGEAAKKKESKGPRVAFRERVSYETDPTKTRDKSSVASMHTAPEQPWPAVDSTQPEGNSVEGKRTDDPSRLNADSARKAFGTRTTPNTKETNDHSSVAGNRSTSRVTDISRTG